MKAMAAVEAQECAVCAAGPEAYEKLPLRAHLLLEDFERHSLDRLSLPGGRPGMRLPEIAADTGFDGRNFPEVGLVTRALFALRGLLGLVFRWDPPIGDFLAESLLSRLTPGERSRSLIPPGTPAGIAQVLYQSDHEQALEIINRTVHCVWVIASEEGTCGYTLWYAVYVRRRNAFTPVYMALVSPLLRRVIYPDLLRAAGRCWARTAALRGA
jgi:hypothetical protein